MSKTLERIFLGNSMKNLTQQIDRYEVEGYVASKRKNLLVNQFKSVIIKPSVLVGIFGVGAATEILASKQSNSEGKSSGVSKMQIVSILSRLI